MSDLANNTLLKLVSPQVLVTGASSGIGLATTCKLLRMGLKVSGVGRDFNQADELLNSAIDDSSAAGFDKIICDLGDVDQLPTKLDKFPSEIGTLVLSAGIGQFGGLEQFSHKQIKTLINVNLVSNLLIIKHYLPLMKRQGGGDVVIVGSESALQGARAGAVYCASKFALRGLAQSLRADCSNSDIRVHLINPGPVDTNFFDELNFAPQAGQEFTLTADDVAGAIINVLSQDRHVVTDEINLQAMKRSFRKK